MASPYIDCDIHPATRRGLKDVMPYVASSWRERLSIYGSGFSGVTSHPSPIADISKGGNYAEDTWAPDGSRPCSDPEHVRTHLLDQRNVLHTVMIPIEPIYIVSMGAIDDAVQLNRAYNDYFIEHWLPVDPRYKLSIGVQPRDPLAAAAEIRRLAGTPGVAAVCMGLLNILLGNRHFHPIYEAAEEAGLPIVIHPGGGQATIAGGETANYTQNHALLPQAGMSSVASLVLEGVFQRFPELKFAFAEYGFSWLPHLLGRMDKNWKSLQVETPWLEEPPSEYVYRHIRFTTQPIDEPERPEHLLQILEMVRAEKTLLFSSDYPHWDNEFPDATLKGLDPVLRRRIQYENAIEFFPGLDGPPREATPAGVAAGSELHG